MCNPKVSTFYMKGKDEVTDITHILCRCQLLVDCNGCSNSEHQLFDLVFCFPYTKNYLAEKIHFEPKTC